MSPRILIEVFVYRGEEGAEGAREKSAGFAGMTFTVLGYLSRCYAHEDAGRVAVHIELTSAWVVRRGNDQQRSASARSRALEYKFDAALAETARSLC